MTQTVKHFLNKHDYCYAVIIYRFLFFTFYFLLSTFHFFVSAQSNYILQKSIPIHADFFTADQLGNIYIVKGNELYKYSTQWEQVNFYSNKVLGDITSVDAFNPLQIVVFYKNNSQVVFLDNTLSVHTTASLENINLELAALVCASFNNSLWIYDQRSFQLVRLNKELKVIERSANISQILSGPVGPINPTQLTERNNRVYLCDSTKGILVFDIFGTYIKTLPFKGIQSLFATDSFLFYFAGGKAFSYSLQTSEQQELKLPEPAFISILPGEKKWYVLTDELLKIYDVKK